MLVENLRKSSSLENQLVNDAELFELRTGSGLGTADGESQAAWPRPNSRHQPRSTQGRAGSPGPGTCRGLRWAAAPPPPARHPGPGQGRVGEEGREAAERKDVVGGWMGREARRGGAGPGRGGARARSRDLRGDVSAILCC